MERRSVIQAAPVKPGAVGAEHGVQLGGREPGLEEVGCELVDPRVGASQEADRPVRAEHQAVGTEHFQNRFQVGQKVRRPPVFRIRLGDEPRDFAVDVRVAGELGNLLLPRLDACLTDPRLGEMIQDKGLLGKATDQFDCGGELAGINQEIVGKPKCGQLRDSPDKGFTGEKTVVGFVLGDVAESRQFWVPRKVGEGGRELVRAEVHPADDTVDARVAFGELEEPEGFLEGLPGLDGDGAFESKGGLERGEVFREPVSVEG